MPNHQHPKWSKQKAVILNGEDTQNTGCLGALVPLSLGCNIFVEYDDVGISDMEEFLQPAGLINS
jgi:hypothetical protein